MERVGMTQKRWEEIVQRVSTLPPTCNGSGSHSMLCDVVAWVQSQGTICDAETSRGPTYLCLDSEDEPQPEPVVIKPLQLEPGDWIDGQERVVRIREWDAPGGRDDGRRGTYPDRQHLLIGEYDYPGGWNFYDRDGRMDGPNRSRDIVRRHVPAPEATVEPKLEEPIGEGVFWAVAIEPPDASPQRIKVRIQRSTVDGSWFVEGPSGGLSYVVPENEVIVKGVCYRLIRRVIEPTTRPFRRDEIESLVGKMVREKPTDDVLLVTGAGLMEGSDDDEAGVYLGPVQRGVTASRLLEDWTFLNGSPCGIPVVDPFDAP